MVKLNGEPILAVDMHTTGQPTRIIYSGFPPLDGSTLLEKQMDVRVNHDHIRKRLMLEPRGHSEMFGALLVNETELTAMGEADIGVLFMHNKAEFSSMCGHATIALGRFLVDFETTDYPGLFPKRNLQVDKDTMTTNIKLHCPCGVVNVTIPVMFVGPRYKLQSDPTKPVSFVGVESYATGLNIAITIPEAYQWPELGDRSWIKVDFAYGGAFFCVVDATELGFGDLKSADLDALVRAAGNLKAALNASDDSKRYCQYLPIKHGSMPEFGKLFGIIVRHVDEEVLLQPDWKDGSELGLCVFGDQLQVDRSPCGSGSAARRAIAHVKNGWPVERKCVYHSFLSKASGGVGGFTASIVEGSGSPQGPRRKEDERIRVRIEGQAFYTGFSSFVVEPTDRISASGFTL